tara:strand:+ start:5029 stop:6072 length:1044 start_codon:yes stop_codon:yes gene_type:complete
MNKIGLIRILKLSLLVFGLTIMKGCSTAENRTLSELDRGYYQNQALSPRVRSQVEESFESVRRIQSSTIYRTYLFPSNQMPTESEIPGIYLDEIAFERTAGAHSTAGTAVVIAINNRRALLLTAAHVVSLPDTLYHYSGIQSDSENRRVAAVSIAQSRDQYVFTDLGMEYIELLAIDENRDLALMKTVSDISETDLKPISIPKGNPNRLDWTDVVYATGYPRGVQMVTRGIASRSELPVRKITLDLSINRGFSGGPLFAVRNDGSGLEWLGTITSAMGERDYFLVPDDTPVEEFKPDMPYRGELYVRSSPRIYYGISNAADINEATNFLRENWLLLLSHGFTPEIFE